VLLNVLPRLNPSQYKTALISGVTKDPHLDLVKQAKAMGIDIAIVPHLVREVNPFRDILALFALISLIRKSDCKIVHTHTSKAGILGRFAAKICGVKIIIHSTHGTIFHGYFHPFVIKLFIILEKLVAPFTDKIICLSTKEIDEHLEKGIGKRAQLVSIYNGIEIAKFEKTKKDPEDKRKELNIEKDDFIGAVVGRLEKVKGHRYLIEAVSLIIRDIPHFKLFIIGYGDEIDDLKKCVKNNNVRSHVFFLGHREDVADILSCIDCFYLPSLNEGFGIALLEAMVMKKPVIASEVGGIPEVVSKGETGIIIPPGDPQAIAQATLRLYRDSELRAKMGRAGYERVKNIFAIENQVIALEFLYENMIRKKYILL